LRQLLPSAARVGALVNSTNPTHESWAREVTAAGSAVGIQVDILRASDSREIEGVFETLVQFRADAVLVPGDPLFFNQRIQLAMLAARHAVPSCFSLREHAEAGGLMSYGVSLPPTFRQLGVYAGRILKGDKPGDLPVQQPTKFELVLNLKTAKKLGLDVPDKLLALADEVIE
jgi:putative tryptophan/tyrosine transport system substrate-binding protein